MPTTFCKHDAYTSLPDEEPESGLLLRRGVKTAPVKGSASFISKCWREVILLALVFIQSIGLYILATQQRVVVPAHCETTRAHSYGQFLYCELNSLVSAGLARITFTAPAQEVLQSEVKVFTVGKPPLYPLTVYQGKGEEADQAWGELYNSVCISTSFI
jgi:hypothetical protein